MHACPSSARGLSVHVTRRPTHFNDFPAVLSRTVSSCRLPLSVLQNGVVVGGAAVASSDAPSTGLVTAAGIAVVGPPRFPRMDCMYLVDRTATSCRLPLSVLQNGSAWLRFGMS